MAPANHSPHPEGPALVILAAGAGSRYGGLKQLAPIGPRDETLLEYSVYDALQAGFGRVVLVIRPETEGAFRERLDTRMARRVPVAYVHQRLDDLPADPRLETDRARCATRTRPWGTAHAVLATAGEVDGWFAVINTDDFYGAGSYLALAEFFTRKQSGRSVAAVGFRVADTLSDAGAVSRALLDVDDAGRLRDIVEIPKIWRQDGQILYLDGEERRQLLHSHERVSMNMWGFTGELLPELRRRFTDFLLRTGGNRTAELLLPEVIRSTVRDGRFRVDILAADGEWCGLTFRQDQPRVRSFIASLVEQGRYPEELWR